MKIFLDTTSFDVPAWVCFHKCYMYTSRSLIGLLWQIVSEWEQDKHLVG